MSLHDYDYGCALSEMWTLIKIAEDSGLDNRRVEVGRARGPY